MTAYLILFGILAVLQFIFGSIYFGIITVATAILFLLRNDAVVIPIKYFLLLESFSCVFLIVIQLVLTKEISARLIVGIILLAIKELIYFYDIRNFVYVKHVKRRSIKGK